MWDECKFLGHPAEWFINIGALRVQRYYLQNGYPPVKILPLATEHALRLGNKLKLWKKLEQLDWVSALQWRHNERDSVSNHQPQDCLLNDLFRPRSKKTSKLCVTGLCVRNSPVTGEFPAQRASNVENISIWWRHDGCWVIFQYRKKTSIDVQKSGPWFNTKISYQYRKWHCG